MISFLHNRQLSHVQEAVIIGIQNSFMQMSRENIFTNEDVTTLLENAIHTYVGEEDTDSENVLAACLNAYGYCLIFSKKYYPNRNTSHEMLRLLNMLFDRLSASLIVARAGQCLLLIELHLYGGSVSHWLSEKHRTPEQIYYVFTRCTFDERRSFGSLYTEDPLARVLLTESTNLFSKFIDELYESLQTTANTCDLPGRALNYIDIAARLCQGNLDTFRAALRQCSFNEQQLKTVLYQASKRRNDLFRQHCVKLYTRFGDMTSELVDMILNMGRVSLHESSFVNMQDLKQMKRISLDRDTIEELYEALKSPSQRIHSVKLLMHLAQIDVVSTLEVHQQISAIIEKLSPDDLYFLRDDYKHFFITLSELSCMSENQFSRAAHHIGIRTWGCSIIYTEREISMAFQRRKWSLMLA